ncbi:hypothetical protein V8G54_012835 [Vigna mungo]|uniref:Uncharacterized protein n=1 Tax=Vigna mungo TaxID=3915 RepID=A0AAQ3NSM2_VIGMU
MSSSVTHLPSDREEASSESIWLCALWSKALGPDDNVCAKGVRCMQRERQALLHLKGGFVDRYGMLSSWTTANSCQWKGNSLKGSIPYQLGNLSKLQHLDLKGNSLEGNVPSQLGKLSNLQKLYLGYGGTLKLHDGAFWLSSLTSLTHLDLSLMDNLNNSHSWLQIIGNLPKLRELSLSDCSLSDHFIHSLSPSKFNSSTSLSVFDLSWNKFTSSMIFQLVSNISYNRFELDLCGNNLLEAPASNHFGLMMYFLERLDLSSNRLKGGAIESFMHMCTLQYLNIYGNNMTEDLSSISFNQMTGFLPDFSMFSNLKILDLSVNRLSGKIPDSSKFPPQLESLSLESNSLEGGVPKSLGSTCTLRSLHLSNNSFNEELPLIMQNLSGCARSSLQELELRMNQIKGTLPDFSVFSSLKTLSLDENRLNGKIPKDIRFPTQLETLKMNLNSLGGVISDSHFANMSKLQLLDLSDNSLALEFSKNWTPSFQLDYIGLRSCKLGPTFPKWFQNDIEILDISNCGISDSVPEWFWSKVATRGMTKMNVSFNKLKGTIPNFPLKVTPHFVVLASNQFEGPIPPFLRGSAFLDLSQNKFSDFSSFLCANGTVEALGQLDLSNNQLSGQIPDCWNHFKSLVYLDLSHNNFSGMVPTSMGSLVELQALLLRNNTLTKEIPFSIRNCIKLVMFDLGDKLQSFEASSYEYNSNLCGKPLDKLCVAEEPPHEANVDESKEDENFVVNGAFYVSMILGFITGLCVTCGSNLFNCPWRQLYFRFLNNLTDNIYRIITAKVSNYKSARICSSLSTNASKRSFIFHGSARTKSYEQWEYELVMERMLQMQKIREEQQKADVKQPLILVPKPANA